MIKYPQDNFYAGHSLVDLNRTGKDEYNLARKKLRKFNLTANSETIGIALNAKSAIHRHINRNCSSELASIQKYEKKHRIAGSVVPADIYLAEMALDFLLDNYEWICGAVLSNLTGAVIKLLKKVKSKNVYDKQIRQIVEKLIKKDSNKVIIKNILEIQVKGKKIKRKQKKRTTKKSRKRSKK